MMSWIKLTELVWKSDDGRFEPGDPIYVNRAMIFWVEPHPTHTGSRIYSTQYATEVQVAESPDQVLGGLMIRDPAGPAPRIERNVRMKPPENWMAFQKRMAQMEMEMREDFERELRETLKYEREKWLAAGGEPYKPEPEPWYGWID